MNMPLDQHSGGFVGVINGIRWVGIREWAKCCYYWHKLATASDIWEWKSGN